MQAGPWIKEQNWQSKRTEFYGYNASCSSFAEQLSGRLEWLTMIGSLYSPARRPRYASAVKRHLQCRVLHIDQIR